MRASRADLPATTIGEYEGHTVDWDGFRVAFESMPAGFPPDGSPFAACPTTAASAPTGAISSRAPPG